MPITKQDHSDLILLLHNIKWLDKKLFAIYFRVTSLVTACVKEVDLMVLSPLYKAWQEAGLDIHNTIHAYHILHDVLQKIVPSKISDYDLNIKELNYTSFCKYIQLKQREQDIAQLP